MNFTSERVSHRPRYRTEQYLVTDTSSAPLSIQFLPSFRGDFFGFRYSFKDAYLALFKIVHTNNVLPSGLPLVLSACFRNHVWEMHPVLDGSHDGVQTLQRLLHSLCAIR